MHEVMINEHTTFSEHAFANYNLLSDKWFLSVRLSCLASDIVDFYINIYFEFLNFFFFQCFADYN